MIKKAALGAMVALLLVTALLPYATFGAVQKKLVTMLTWSHFVPGYNAELQREVEQWGAIKGVDVRVDFLSLTDITTRLAAEVQAQKGHDVVMTWNFTPALYKDNLVPLDGLAAELQNQYGDFDEGGKYLCLLDGHWMAIPWTYQSLLANINTQYWGQIGYTADQVGKLTWNQFLDAAQKLDAIGHPVGFALSDTFDANGGLYPILWDFGAKVVDENGNITINSDKTRAAIEYVMKLAKYMPSEIFAWDGGGNNKFMLSGTGSWTPNPPSIRPVAVRDKLPVADFLDHVPLPSGPAGHYRVADYINLGIWKFSPNVDLAKDLIRFLLRPDNIVKQVEASQGYNCPTLKAYDGISYWMAHPSLRYYFPPVEDVRPSGWPAPPGPGIQTAYNLYVVSTMFAKAVTGRATVDEAMQWAEQQLKDIYGK